MRRSSRFNRPGLTGSSRSALLLNNDGDGSTLNLDFTTGVLDPRLTFTRASGGTYVANNGYIYGMDFATSSSLAIGTGSKSVTLTATASVDRRYLVGQTVYISNGANNMSGPVTAYNASTQVLTINATATSGSGSFTSWTVGNASARFDHDPTTLAPRGLLIEGTATSLSRSSQNLTDAAYWTLQTAYASTSATGGTAPDGTNTGNLFTEPSSNLQRSIYQSYGSAAGTYTFSLWLKAGSGSTRYMRLVVSSGASDFGYVTVNMSTGAIQQAATVVGTATNASATVSGNYTATGWRRYSLTVTLAASVNFVFLVPSDLASIDTPTTNYGRVSYLGDGSSFLIWGAQLEAGSGSSYIPTGASTVQRLADFCTMPTSSFIAGPLYPQTLFAECIPANPSAAFPDIVRLFDRTAGGTFSYGTELYYYGSSTMTAQRKTIASTNSDRPLASGLAYNSRHKLAVAVDSSAFLGSYDGLTSSGATTAPPALASQVTHMGIGCTGDASAASVMFGTIRQIKFFPFAMAQSQLNTLTTL